MNRRSFIKNASVLGAVSALPLSTSRTDFKVGLTKGLFERAGIYSNPDSFVIFNSFAEAAKALNEGKISAFVSSSFFASNFAPELTLFGSFPTAFSGAQKQDFIKNNQSIIHDLISPLNLKSDLVGVMSNEQIRFSKLSGEQVLKKGSRFDNMVTAASGARALWFEDMGFKVHQHSWSSCVFENLLFLTRHDLQITESHSAVAFSNALNHNDQIAAAKIENYSGLTVFKDNLSYGPVPVEFFYSSNDMGIDGNLIHLKKSIATALAAESELRRAALQEMTSSLKLNVEELPHNLKTEIAKRARAHLSVIANYSTAGKEAVLNLYSSGGIANV